MLEEAIEKAQDNDPEATVFMIEKFKPLLRNVVKNDKKK